jgi:hypothetical protein
MDAALDSWLARLPAPGPQSAFDGVAQIAVQHGRLAGRPDVKRWRTFWKTYLEAF